VSGALPWVAIGIIYVVWGSTYLANRLILETVPPLLTGAFRSLVGGGVLALVVVLVAGRAAFRMTRAQFGTTALSGLLLPAWGNGLIVVGQQQVASGIAALLIAAVPLYVVVLRALGGDRPRTSTLVGVGVGVVGLAVLLLAGPGGSGGAAGHAWWGAWLVLLAGVGWAVGTFALTRLPVPPNAFALAAVQMLVGGAVLLVVSVGVGERVDVTAIAPVAWWGLVYMALAVSLVGFAAYAYAVATLPVSTVATYAYVNPVIAVLLGILVIGERFSVVQLIGGAVVVAAVVLVIVAERRGRNRRGPVAPSPA
jgi:drug/metabolite transporter (DMT)-like permease